MKTLQPPIAVLALISILGGCNSFPISVTPQTALAPEYLTSHPVELDEMPSRGRRSPALPALTLTPTLAPAMPSMSDVIKGAGILVYGDKTDRVRRYMFTEQIQPIGFNWVSLVVYCYQEVPSSTEIDCDRTDGPTTSDTELTKQAEVAHSLGLRVMLHPQLVSLSDAFPISDHGSDEDAWQLWFENYATFIRHYARLAREIGADYFVIGNEMYGTTQRADDWRGVADAVREEYFGRITYAAHMFDVFTISWWDAVDVIGVNAYFPLTPSSNDPTLEQIEAGWIPILGDLGQLALTWNRQIVITEILYPSIQGANSGGDTRSFCARPEIDLEYQADLYQALLDSFEGKPWWLGVFWWVWSGNPAEGGPYDKFGPPLNKPAEDVLRLHYGGESRPAAISTPAFAENPDLQLTIHDGTLDPNWYLFPSGSSADLYYQADTYQGKAVIEFDLDGTYYELDAHTAAKLTQYDWLEFYVQFIGNSKPGLSLWFGYWTPDFHEASTLTLGPSGTSTYFTDAGNRWLRVLVPLSDVFPDQLSQSGDVYVNELGFRFGLDGCPGHDLEPPHSKALLAQIRFLSSRVSKP